VRRLLIVLLLVEAFLTGAWLARLLALLPAYGWSAIGLVAARTGAAVLQVIGGITLSQGRSAGPRLARGAFLVSAVILTIEQSTRLTPTNVFPGHRPVVISAYWAYALIGMWLSRRVSGRTDDR
jgi:hypothetical protein